MSLTSLLVSFCCLSSSSILALIWGCLHINKLKLWNADQNQKGYNKALHNTSKNSNAKAYSEHQIWPRITAISCRITGKEVKPNKTTENLKAISNTNPTLLGQRRKKITYSISWAIVFLWRHKLYADIGLNLH